MKKLLLLILLVAANTFVWAAWDGKPKYELHTTAATKTITVRGGVEKLFRFSCGVACVKHKKGWFVIDKQGNKLFDLPQGYHPAGSDYDAETNVKFSNDRLLILKSEGYYNVNARIIDKRGATVKDLGKLAGAYPMIDGVARIVEKVGFREKVSYINSNGQKIAAHWEVKSAEAKETWFYVAPMAAGGAYETDIYFGQLTQSKGEIHTLMKETGWNGNPLDHHIINAGPTFQKIQVDTLSEMVPMGYVWNVGNGQGQYATHLSQLFAEGYIRLHCKFDDKNAEKIITSGTIKTDKNTSTAPQMMLLPKYFEWPQEEYHISDAYRGFSDWVSDITKTSWILDTQVPDSITDRGDLKPENPQEAVDPSLIEAIEVPFHGGQFIFDPAGPDEYVFNNGIFISLAGIQELRVNDEAKATVIVHYANKPANIYFDDANGNLLVYDKFGDGQQHTTYYTFSAKRFNQAVESGGMWLLQDEDRPFTVTKVEIELIGVTDPSKRHNLVVSPITMTFDELEQTMQITATSSTGANISYSSTDTRVATFSIDNGIPTVQAKGEGKCQIIVTAEAGNGYAASVERINVVVDRTPTMPLTVGEPAWHDNVTEGSSTYYYIYHRELTTYTDLSGWTNGASITFRYEGYIYGQYRPNFFRVLNPAGTVIAGDFSRHDAADGDITYTISGTTPNITSASVTKIAN